MKKSTLYSMLLPILSLFVLTTTQAQQRSPRLDSLLKEKDQTIVNSKLDQLQKSDKEADLNLVAEYYASKDDMAKYEQLRDIIAGKFPFGSQAHVKLANALVVEHDPEKKEAKVKEMDRDFPKYDNSMYYFDVANTYAKQKKVKTDKVLEYVDKMSDKNNRGMYHRIICETLMNSGEAALAKKMVGKTLESLKAESANNPSTETQPETAPGPQGPRRDLKAELSAYGLLYAKILNKEGHKDEALDYVTDAYKTAARPGTELSKVYLTLLVENNKLAEAYPLMIKAYRRGDASPAVKDKLKEAYISAKGSENGYDELISSIRSEMRDTANARIVKFAVNKLNAPTFKLKNLQGKTLSLESLKGKVVILDFWATWCGPCKASFPAMQQAVNKYKDDKNVVFLFIDTWEHVDNPLPDVKGYITENQYTFNVLMDVKDPVTKKNNVIESFKVSGIPTKFVIDKNGDIRYRLTGFSAGDDAAVEELSAMIEKAKS